MLPWGLGEVMATSSLTVCSEDGLRCAGKKLRTSRQQRRFLKPLDASSNSNHGSNSIDTDIDGSNAPQPYISGSARFPTHLRDCAYYSML